MRYLTLLVTFHVCGGVLIHINPIQIIAYRKNRTTPQVSSNDTDTFEKYRLPEPFGCTHSYAGHLMANEKYDSNLFFMFFPSETAFEAPLVVWLQGQPNTSSLYGLYDEHGPYEITTDGKTRDREYSWNHEYNVLYLDPYTSCGYSYSKHPLGYSMSLKDVSENIIQALRQFFEKFSHYKSHDLYLAGESMMGKYLFVIAHGIHRLNQISDHFNLKGLLIGNPFTHAGQMAEHGEFIYQMGLLDRRQYDQLKKVRARWHALIRSSMYDEAIDYWYKYCYSQVLLAGYQSMYDVRDLNSFWNSKLPKYLDKPKTKEILQRISTFEDLRYIPKFQTPAEHSYFIKEAMSPIQSILPEVLNNYKVLFYSAQFDMFVPYVHTAYFLDQMEWEGVKPFYTAAHQQWRDNKGHLIGYYKTAGNLTHVMIRDAGHMVGITQPESLFLTLKTFITNGFVERNILTNFEDIFKNTTDKGGKN